MFATEPEAAGTYQGLIDHLNSVAPVDGWFTKHYGEEPNSGCSVQRDGLKKPWQIHNTRKLDGVRAETDRLGLDRIERAVALTSLILALDRVDSTLGHFVSYLNDWSPRSYNELYLRVPDLFVSQAVHTASRGDAFEVAGDNSVDLAYFDPPYGSNNEKMPPSRLRYAAYYHLWTSVYLSDEPEVFGRARRRRNSSDRVAGSVFEDFRRNAAGDFIAVEAVGRLLESTAAPWVILSYSFGGQATAAGLLDAIRRSGSIRELVELDHRRNVMATMRWTNEWVHEAEEPNREFLFLIER